MNNELLRILDVLEKLNNYTHQSIVDLEVLEVERDRLKDLKILDHNVNTNLIALKNQSILNVNDIEEHLCFLDVNVGIYAWHCEEIRNITEKFIGLYREKNFWKDSKE